MSRFSSTLLTVLLTMILLPAAAHADGKGALNKLDKDACSAGKHFWYGPHGGSCHACPVGKLRHLDIDSGKDTCDCLEGFVDLGPRRSCACPRGMLVTFHPRAHCEPQSPEGYATSDRKVNESDDAKANVGGGVPVDDEDKGVCRADVSCKDAGQQKTE